MYMYIFYIMTDFMFIYIDMSKNFRNKNADIYLNLRDIYITFLYI